MRGNAVIKVMAKPGEICAAWWHTELGIDTGSARKTRSELRRAETTLAALGVTAVHELNSELVKAGYDLRERKDGADRLALIARVLAHVTEPIGKPLARSLGDGTPTGSPPPFSRIRFDSLIRTEKPSELVGLMVRALRIIKGSTDLRRLANDLYWWNDQVRIDWCFDYHGASIAKPELREEETPL